MSRQGHTGDDVLIVVPCLNEEAHLPSLLDALVADAPGALVVVADGGSTDRSRAIVTDRAATHPQVRLLDNAKRLQAAGVNVAVQAYGDGRRWLVRVDAHCAYPRSYITTLLTAAQRTGADAVVVPMRTVGRSGFQRAVAAAQNSVLGTGGSPHRHVREGRFVDHGHHALCRLALFRDVGGYDESFRANEDAELDHRLGLAGGRIWLEPAAAIDYFPRSTIPSLMRQYHAYGRGRAMNLMRHGMPIKLRQMAPLAVPPAVLLALASPVAPWLAIPAAVWALACLLGGVVLAARQRRPAIAAAGVAAMTMHLGWGTGFWRQLLSASAGRGSPADRS